MSHFFRRRLIFLLSFYFSRQKLSQIFLFVKWFFEPEKVFLHDFFYETIFANLILENKFRFRQSQCLQKIKWEHVEVVSRQNVIFLPFLTDFYYHCNTEYRRFNELHQSFSTWVDTFAYCQLFTSLSPNMFSKLCS